MAQLSVLIAGCGDLGNALGERLIEAGFRVYGLRRNIDQLSDGILPIEYDLLNADAPPNLPQVDYLVYAAAAKSRVLDTYRTIYLEAPQRILKALPRQPRRMFLTSSTGVYAQHQHEWIDESSDVKPNNPFGQLLFEGECALAASGVPMTAVRCSGIYGPGREHLLNRIRAGEVAPDEPVHFSNRIHREDAAGFIAHLIQMDMKREPLKELYLATDDEPTPIAEITQWLATKLGVDIISRTPIQRGGSKRCRNDAMSATGYALRYPTYREGFDAMLRPD